MGTNMDCSAKDNNNFKKNNKYQHNKMTMSIIK